MSHSIQGDPSDQFFNFTPEDLAAFKAWIVYHAQHGCKVEVNEQTATVRLLLPSGALVAEHPITAFKAACPKMPQASDACHAGIVRTSEDAIGNSPRGD